MNGVVGGVAKHSGVQGHHLPPSGSNITPLAWESITLHHFKQAKREPPCFSTV